jgi:hypothetical protein
VSPALVLVTDGYHTNPDEFEQGLAALDAEPWGRQAVRKAIAIGRDVDVAALKRFQGHDGEPLQVDNAGSLVQAIRWTSRLVVDSASQTIADSARADSANARLPDPVEW